MCQHLNICVSASANRGRGARGKEEGEEIERVAGCHGGDRTSGGDGREVCGERMGVERNF